jgi:hypothetical protein
MAVSKRGRVAQSVFMEDDEDALVREWQAEQLLHCQAVIAEYGFIRDILRGKRPLDDLDEPSPLDDYLGVSPTPTTDSAASVDPEATVEAEAEVETPTRRRAPPALALVKNDDGDDDPDLVKRKFMFGGAPYVVEVDEDAYLVVIPARDRLGQPVLRGRLSQETVLVESSSFQHEAQLSLVETVQKLLSKELARRRR